MSTPREPGDSKTSVRQSDRAQFGNEATRGTFCRECRGPILDEYYDVDGNVVCSSCLAKRTQTRSRLFRAFKALLLGSLAAGVGAGVYRMIIYGTGWNFSLVAILVGYMVGGAVKTGSRERGGRFYQFLAVFLTYSALVGMFLPDLWNALSSGPREGKAAEKRIEKQIRKEAKTEPGRKADTKAAENSAQTKADARPDAAPSKPVVEAEAKNKPAVLDVKGGPRDVGERPRPGSVSRFLYLLGMLILTLLLLVGFVYSIPVVVGIHSPISLLIFGIGLWQAWRMNRAGEVSVTGPYRIRG